tara:strand:+ start:179 stop:406 length:228 start_codon:yes stop_codon:yes gene_type:complete
MKRLTVEQRRNRSTWFISGILSALLLVLVLQEPGLFAATALVEIAVTWLLGTVMLWPLAFIVLCFGQALGIQPRQ